MPKISDQRREERRDSIVQAALRCFLRSGYQQTSMADIIAESGLSAGAIYGYFPSKQELIRGVATHVIGGRRDEMQAAAAQHPLSPAEVISVLVNGTRAHVPAQAVVQVWSEATVDPELRALLNESVGGLRAAITQTLGAWAAAAPGRIPEDVTPEQRAAHTAPTLLGLLPGFLVQHALIDGFDADAYLDGAADLLRS